MKNLDFRRAYLKHRDRLLKANSRQRAMELGVGGSFEATGIIEREILIMAGLTPESDLVDVGCGSGRLTCALAGYLKGRYLGTDVVPDFLQHARGLAPGSNFRFELVRGLKIPAGADEADMICFFSVFTHLLHEQSYMYLQDARRVLRPGGKIVFSFLEFAIKNHWNVFSANLEVDLDNRTLNMFMSRDAIAAWADRLGLIVEGITDGDKSVIPIPHVLEMDDGTVMSDTAFLGQSWCILAKPGG